MSGAVANCGVTGCWRRDDEPRDLSRRLIAAHEEERARLARELHDDVSQRLAVLSIELARLVLAAAGGPHLEALNTVREELMRVSTDVRSLAYQLHPSVLDDLGLAGALRSECQRRQRHGGIPIAVDIGTLPSVVGRDQALCLFRVAQEALNNVVRHASAQSARVVLRGLNGGLHLAVRDDGVGFDPSEPRGRRTLGLASMSERVQLVNGTFGIDSAPGLGTEVLAWVPAGDDPAFSGEETGRTE
jgi:signal transduction histidine kinase